jgi:hypothetical protein
MALPMIKIKLIPGLAFSFQFFAALFTRQVSDSSETRTTFPNPRMLQAQKQSAHHSVPSPRFFFTSNLCNCAEGASIDETESLGPTGVGIDKCWLHQHKQSVDTRYIRSTEFRSGCLQPFH